MPGIDAYTKLMLHCDGVDESTNFIDSSLNPHTVTANGNAQIDTAQSKFGGASGLFGAFTDYLSVPDSTDWDFDSDDFTIDCWLRLNSASPSTTICSRVTSGSSYFYISWEGGNLRVRDFGGTIDFSKTIEETTGEWFHLAIVRSGNDFMIFKNGIQQGTTYTNSASFIDRSVALEISRMSDNSGYYLDGWIDEFRWSKGIARWTENFTPPTEPYSGNEILNLEETITLSDDWVISTPGVLNVDIEESITLSDDWLIQANPELVNILETVSLSDEWGIEEIVSNAVKIISYNPLIYVTNTNPAKIVQVDISNPASPIKNIYTIIGNSYAKDIVFNSTNDYFYVACANRKVVKINKNDLEDQTIIDTLDIDILQNIDSLDASLMSYVSTDDSNGEIILIDEREIKKINTDLRLRQQIIKKINTQLNLILGKLINTDLRLRKINSKIINTDLRILANSYEDINKYPISYTDWEVYINGTELTVLDDVDMNSILITHDVTQEEAKGSQAQFILNRRHDKLDYINTGASNQITNNNTVIVKIKGITEFTGKISNLTANSETETVNVIAIGTRPSDKRHKISIPMSSLNEELNLYHCLINNISIDNPYINPDDENPEYYKGIQIDLGTQIRQNIIRLLDFGPYEEGGLVQEIENGEFTPLQNWSYFWFASFEHITFAKICGTNTLKADLAKYFDVDESDIKYTSFIPKKEEDDPNITWNKFFHNTKEKQFQGVIADVTSNTSSRYLGTSLGSLSGDTWKILNCNYKYQKELEDTETELGLYQVGNAPYNKVSVKNGKKITKDKWVDKNDGLYIVRDEGYDYIEYAKRIANLEYQKLLNINGQILPITNTLISLSVDAYYYYNIGLLTRINVTNTTTSNIYNKQNGFPVAVKNIRIQCNTEGENSMIVDLTCDNQKSQLELEEIDAQYPDENSDEFVVEAKEALQYYKFDPNAWGFIN